ANAQQPLHTPSTAVIPPYDSPAYTKPSDDRVAFDSLLEAAGYSPAMRHNGWVGVAAGNFCGGFERQLIVATDAVGSDLVLNLLQGPTPHLVAKIDPKLGQIGTWRAVAAGKLESNIPRDQIVAVVDNGGGFVPDFLLVLEVSTRVV